MRTTQWSLAPLLVVVGVITASLGQAEELRVGKAVSNPCNNVETCGKCLRTASTCAWCQAANFPRFSSRCDIYEHLKTVCPPDELVYPQSDLLVVQNDNVRGGDTNRHPIQVQPQVLNITARTNDPINFKLSFRQAENYPVDLYFLLDLSYTMVKDENAQRRLTALGKDIPISMANITTDFNLGFGTFVDKTVMPFSAWTDEMLKRRCPKPDKSCSPPHNFINQLKLGDGKNFSTSMTEALEGISQSYDDTEGGLDGLMQALVCEEAIGWRERSRRIIVYSSNSMFHVAGMGLLGGTTKNNNGECHLDNGRDYAHSLEYDFPSVSQIATKLKEKSTSVIFAVMPDVYKHYERFRALTGNAEIGELADKSSNIINLIRNNYDKLRSRIHFTPRKADGVEFTFLSKCLDDVVRETAMCDKLEMKDSVTFDVSMTVTSDVCKGQSGTVRRQVELATEGLNEKLTINLDVICDCQCERPSFEVVNSENCTDGNGTLVCGICSCNDGRYGRVCECNEADISSQLSLEKCRLGNDTDVCSGHGECICGQCECFPIANNPKETYTKQHCECNDYSCPSSGPEGLLCGGPFHGRCDCGQCDCFKDWQGPACECSTKNKTCIAANGELCNGYGECVCGRCICFKNTDYMGPTCEACPNCPSKCSQYRDCAQCRAFHTGKYTDDQCDTECKEEITLVDELKVTSDRVTKCDFRDTDKCLFHFTYEYDQDNNAIIKVQRTKECPEEVNLGLILGPVVAGIVIIPLLLLCIFIFIRNRRDAAEFARFMKEKDKARWESESNPIYRDPKTTFKNPTYKGGN
ncbi:integrin beta pat-3-like [Babylonia areolata]|uniref:integrin beta pat-3-like n=1 Tax=Babylonia areolata TaxID=304850 RepID=UPI003FD45CBE